jgi:CDGSH-type Zn-finger protein
MIKVSEYFSIVSFWYVPYKKVHTLRKECIAIIFNFVSNQRIWKKIMSEPKIVDKKPVVLELEPKTYYWCTCGESTNQPYCNGAHKGTDFTPLAFEVTETKKVALCLCKHTGNAPFCDGAHTKL